VEMSNSMEWGTWELGRWVAGRRRQRSGVWLPLRTPELWPSSLARYRDDRCWRIRLVSGSWRLGGPSISDLLLLLRVLLLLLLPPRPRGPLSLLGLPKIMSWRVSLETRASLWPRDAEF
jgi:hypothetical protein